MTSALLLSLQQGLFSLLLWKLSSHSSRHRRELALQIYHVAETFFPPNGFTLSLVIGGADAEIDARGFSEKGGHVIVGTPGRLEQLLQRPGINVKSLEVLVLDEADRYVCLLCVLLLP